MPRTWKPSPHEWRTTPRPRGWHKLRTRILRRDPHCTLRTHCAGAPATEVDHIAAADDHDPTNLRGVCGPCHRHRTGQQGAAAANAQRPTRRRPTATHPGLAD